MDAARLGVQWVSLTALFCSPSNPRHNDEAVPHVAASLRRFGWQQPIVAKPSGEVIAGNTRLKAAKSLGMTEVPVVRFEGSDLEATAFQIADNRTHEFATWDDTALSSILQSLRAEDALDGVGYSSSDIDALIDQLQAESGGVGDVDLDAIPLPPDEATTRTGDLWVLGNHRLLCGDSSSPADLDRLLAGAQVHLVNTDPPYNVKVEPRSNNAIAAGNSSFTKQATHHQKLDLARHPEKAKGTTAKMRAKDRPLANDFVSDGEFDRLLAAWFGNIARVLVPGRSSSTTDQTPGGLPAKEEPSSLRRSLQDRGLDEQQIGVVTKALMILAGRKDGFIPRQQLNPSLGLVATSVDADFKKHPTNGQRRGGGSGMLPVSYGIEYLSDYLTSRYTPRGHVTTSKASNA